MYERNLLVDVLAFAPFILASLVLMHNEQRRLRHEAYRRTCERNARRLGGGWWLLK